jgi:triosephosphate isomerase
MLKDAGASLTIVGHSERREAHGESNADVRVKAESALRQGFGVILCIGESLEVRNQGQAVATVAQQLDDSLPQVNDTSRLAIAYEPIWAIGTGLIPSTAEIAEMHGALRERLVSAFGEAGTDIRILYGGSVKGSNACRNLRDSLTSTVPWSVGPASPPPTSCRLSRPPRIESRAADR